MPEYLCVRIETALAVESSHRVATQPASEAGRRDLPARSRGDRRFRMPKVSSPVALRLVAATGALVIVGGGAYEIVSHSGAGPSSSSSVNAPAAAAAGSASAGHVRFGPNISYRAGGHNHTVEAVETGANFVPASFGKQSATAMSDVRVTSGTAPQSLKASATKSPVPSNGSAAHAGAFAPLRSFVVGDLPRLRGCVGLIAAGRDVLMVDIAKYAGQAATIIVVGNGSQPPEAFAVGSRCSATMKDILGHELLP